MYDINPNLNQAETLPADFYQNPAVWEACKEKIFCRSWQFLGDEQRIFAGPTAEGLTDREKTLLQAVDEFVTDRDLSDETFAALSGHLNRQQLIEFCTLAGHYDAIAGILAALRVPMDFPD